MRTGVPQRGRGIGARILRHIMEEAVRSRVRVPQPRDWDDRRVAPARALYERHGFELCGPFDAYTGDANSVFMTKRL